MTLEQKHLGRVAALGCVICNTPPSCHHMRLHTGMGRKESDYRTIPLCHHHHQGAEGFHTLGRRRWEEKYGSQELHWVNIMTEIYGDDPETWPKDDSPQKYPLRR